VVVARHLQAGAEKTTRTFEKDSRTQGQRATAIRTAHYVSEQHGPSVFREQKAERCTCLPDRSGSLEPQSTQRISPRRVG
jgi:hypothetical protein